MSDIYQDTADEIYLEEIDAQKELLNNTLSIGLNSKIAVSQAMDSLIMSMQEDECCAWGWHCYLATVAQDAGAPHKEAHERAAWLMMAAFGVDTTKPPNPRVLKSLPSPMEYDNINIDRIEVINGEH